ncbi:PpiC-type peptidyl-prolyl cis-trans isomerase [Methylobacterium sp. 4-46]|uniref:peptidyl-prolyl cis-trans isomerase n=1 Tax=unclassified Methylobacterium TaxID=2615210 RepID=UPI000152D689|nr:MULTISPECIES: peptidyl-prolyl cis-trans isomerase [Methylobacterium]ACA19715.1 PpiC-type peptidyl-prolyl cis-trans isomerase [Methylobacterium sp. 4-46]WFT78910.1 peptidyl-prolyl cis-trans isomerase [Methylobacterium nodulans]
MLQGFRAASESWLGKIVITVVFGLLIAGLAIFGIGDIFRGGGTAAVATVGSTKISAEAVRSAYQNQIQRLARQARRPITPDQARALGLDREVLSALVTEATLDQKTRELGLRVGDDAVIRLIKEEPAFKGANGAFDIGVFNDTLRQAGLSEAAFVQEQRAVAARLQLAESLTADLTVPLAVRDAIHRYTTERRSAAFILLPESAAGEIPAPTEEEARTYYEEHKGGFRAPEIRGVTILVLDPTTLAKPDAVTAEEARARYDADRGRYGTPEKRTIQQIVFPNEADAAAALKRIRDGEAPFESIAGERGLDPKSLDLGTFTRAELFDPAVADAAFALPQGTVSEPVKGRFGTVLLRVTAIEPGSIKPFEEVADQIRTEIARERARDGLEKVHDAIEDQRAGAKPLTEIARERDLPLVTVPATDAQGRDPKGQPVEGLPDKDAVLPAIFRSEMGADSEALRTRAGGYLWYDVTRIDPAHDRPLDEVRDQVAAQWKADEVEKRLAAKAREAAERLDKGETIEAVAAAYGVEARHASDLARGRAKDGLTPESVGRIFATAVGKTGSASAGDKVRAAFKVTSATVPPLPSGPQGGVEQQYRQALADDVLAEYIADAQRQAGVSVNEAAFRRAIGGEY